MLLIEAIVIGAVSYRLWRLVAEDEVTARLRERYIIDRGDLFVTMWYCPWCLGTWITIAVGLAAYLTGLTVMTPWLVIPAAATVTGLLPVLVRSD